ncbi:MULTISPECIES: Ig domain-containing protein [unclassified Agarivorans]|uniref:Ig domain-containing protein n=1 Tax=unclassified Agarivorans TaxID=2636026 RepID=UPI0026E24683|nr:MULTISPECIES: Ig domain-containing protein [unclassified Agarivorans]MDO6684971.1 Ig domain-containing protein [Agarivorans sp. 3_MG-2023]MDO6714868.1 Ig domain-containing protein [Agarivorans sp. 2_MG-2023]
MKKVSLLTAAVALALSGCGSDSNDSPSSPSLFTVTAIDGYLANADVYAGDSCELRVGATDDKGELSLSAEHADKTICIKAIAGVTVDSNRGVVVDEFELAAPAGSAVVSPMTNLVVEQMIADDSLSQEQAEAAVVDSFNSEDSDVVYTEQDIFGDYIEAAESGDEKAEAVNIVGETLVDNDDVLDPSEQLKVIEDVSKETSEIIADPAKDLEHYSPVVVVDPTNGYEKVETNYRPYVDLEQLPAPVSIELGESVDQDVSLYFNDANEADVLSYSMDAFDSGLSIDSDSGIISGTPQVAGQFTLYVYASDQKTRSYPLVLELNVSSPNQAPMVNTATQQQIQEQLLKLELRANEQVNETIDLTQLFEDDDALIISADSNVPGLTLRVEQEQLLLGGTPTTRGDFVLSIGASDSINAEVRAHFAIAVAKAFNHAPEVNKTAQALVQEQLNALELKVATSVDSVISLSDLFTDNEDFTLTVSTDVLGLSASLEADNLLLVGTPTKQQTGRLTVSATDSENPAVDSNFALVVAAADLPVDPVEPVVPVKYRFKEEHFAKAGAWRMGEVGMDHDGIEFGWVSLRIVDGEKQFCWNPHEHDIKDAADLVDVEANPPAEEEWRCDPVTLNQDGSLSMAGDDEGDADFSFVATFEYAKDNHYQIMFAMDNELFWLDSNDIPFTHTAAVPVANNTLYQAIEDHPDGTDIFLQQVVYKQTSQNIYVNSALKAGSFEATWPHHNWGEQGFSGDWTVTAENDIQRLNLSSSDEGDFTWVYMRTFGEGEQALSIIYDQAEGESLFTLLESENLTLIESTIQQWNPSQNPEHNVEALIGKNWYYTEYGSDDGDDSTSNFTRIWCDTALFEDGKMFMNRRSPENLTSCDTQADVEVGEYKIVNNKLSIRITAEVDDTISATQFEYTELFIQALADDLSEGAFMVEAFGGERYAYYSDLQEAEKRLQSKSSDTWFKRAFDFYLPKSEALQYQLGTVSLSMKKDTSDLGALYDADLYFDPANGESISCSTIREFYSAFTLNGPDGFSVTSTECFDLVENGVQSAAYDFDFSRALNDGDTYSFIGKVKDDQSQFMEAVKYNMQWVETISAN